MQSYSEVVPPTAVSHAVSLPFLHAKAHNLVVAKTSLLQIFELKSISTEVSTSAAADGGNGGAQDVADEAVDLELHRMEDTTRLSLISEYQLAGTVTALKRVRIQNSKSGGEALLMACRDAKLSLVEWDPEQFRLSTVSVHYYEGEGLQSSPWAPDLSSCHNFLTVDPSSRCAALKFAQRQLAILPFRQVADDFAEDYDPDFDEPMDKPRADAQKKDGEGSLPSETPYKASFALSLTALDPSLTHPVHLAFLHGFRDPTFGILYSSKTPSAALLHERRDILSYTVFNLDLDQRASTSILSVTGLPNDLFQVIALPAPVGGALLIGNNELVHIDQDGKVNALAVNEFARVVSKFAMADASALGLRLEHCTVQTLGEQGDMLLGLVNGDLVIVSFDLEGRSVSGIRVHRVSPENGGTALSSGPCCATILSKSRFFFGSQDGDSMIIGWSSKQTPPQLTRKRSHGDAISEDEDLELEDAELLDDEEDDIYGADDTSKQKRQGSAQDAVKPNDYVFRVHDRLPNFAPTGPMTLGTPTTTLVDPAQDLEPRRDTMAPLEMVYPCGRSVAGGLAALTREVEPTLVSIPVIPKAKAVWGVRPVYDLTASADFHEYVVAVQSSEDADDRSVLFKIMADGLEPCDKDDFEPDAGATLEIGTLSGGERILQVLKDNVKVYDESKSFLYFPKLRYRSRALSDVVAYVRIRTRAMMSKCKALKCLAIMSDVTGSRCNSARGACSVKLQMPHIARMQSVSQSCCARSLRFVSFSHALLPVLIEVVLTWPSDFGLEQIIPASDETTGVELEIIGASFCDPYISLIRDDSSIAVWQSATDELIEVERANGITAAKWLSASLYKPPKSERPLLFALTAEGALRVRRQCTMTNASR